mgnify:CR=1 FL=1
MVCHTIRSIWVSSPSTGTFLHHYFLLIRHATCSCPSGALPAINSYSHSHDHAAWQEPDYSSGLKIADYFDPFACLVDHDAYSSMVKPALLRLNDRLT